MGTSISSRRNLLLMATALAVLAWVSLGLLVRSTAVNVPHWDEWEFFLEGSLDTALSGRWVL
jgi:hypothetical protein